MPTVFDQQISEFSLEIHPWIFLKHLLNHLWRHLIEAQAKQFEPGAEMHQCYFFCQASCRFLVMYEVLLLSKRGRPALVAPDVSRRIGERHPPPSTSNRLSRRYAGTSPRSCRAEAQKAASSSATERPMLWMARLPKMYVRRQWLQRNPGELDSKRSIAALHSAVSGIVTRATDFKRAKTIGLVLEPDF